MLAALFLNFAMLRELPLDGVWADDKKLSALLESALERLRVAGGLASAATDQARALFCEAVRASRVQDIVPDMELPVVGGGARGPCAEVTP